MVKIKERKKLKKGFNCYLGVFDINWNQSIKELFGVIIWSTFAIGGNILFFMYLPAMLSLILNIQTGLLTTRQSESLGLSNGSQGIER